MLDVWGLVSNSLWVLGLAVLLAIWSWARFAAYQAGVRPRAILSQTRYVVALDAGLLLFVAGMAATETRWWARVIWFVLGAWVLAHAVLRLLQSAKTNAR
ncbi:MAG: hypothetical protein MUF84_15905 [Anaerolineae bacterium]|jgi:hypothetical protein|nr:hypothetical protein [Anaerolineae bacterium]